MFKTELLNATLVVYNDSTYCPIAKEYEDIVKFELSHIVDGQKIILENDSLNLECLDSSVDYLLWKLENLSYNPLRQLYHEFMYHYGCGLLGITPNF